jgi:hypothetical protein
VGGGWEGWRVEGGGGGWGERVRDERGGGGEEGLPADCIRHPVEEVWAKERGVDGEGKIQASRG